MTPGSAASLIDTSFLATAITYSSPCNTLPSSTLPSSTSPLSTPPSNPTTSLSLPIASQSNTPVPTNKNDTTKIILVVVIPLAVILLAILAYVGYRRRMNNGRTGNAGSSPFHAVPQRNPEVHDNAQPKEPDENYGTGLSIRPIRPVHGLPSCRS